ncbi:glycoside hydrolase family 47 protein [Wickerhamomyces anomalus NRRL Y-366-8]|uniref:alpha-1,2-Mannosidase n=1 Tax=Wickerhamomyces anomalus (strain ATCC 58044 / CBS 1984 / NCYC 433 / NRRL Y-366-8) TaxID=683960 RepID=A0A1E3P9M3_WICAA|nr:glycoside hydrolase family 47 protein [Wickerhamomyces anomalus NRRL Y-366-8]ODQ62068.1 glycoside hydrolase family 47 protein [Wickerhamomyces anomalus NRRL Y-366-8]
MPDDYFKNQKGTNLRKHKKKYLYPVGKENLIKFPKISKKENYSGVQSTYFNDGGRKVQDKLNSIKEAFRSSWSTYKKHGYGHDEVRPISHKASDPFNGWSSTIIDALDTLWIINEKEEFAEAVNFIEKINFKQSFREDIPIFENIIRILGGLIGGYDLSNEQILLNSAVEFADFLIEAFDTPNHMPLLYYRWQDEMPNRLASREACLAEVGSLTLEFSRLTQLTGDNKYYDAVARITDFFQKSVDRFFMKGLVPNKLDISGFFPRQAKQRYSLGGLADSYYEYLPKMYHLLRGDEKHAKVYKDLYLAALNDIKNYMLFMPKIPGGEKILFASSIGVYKNEDKIIVEQELDMQHLTCFAGGMFGLGARVFNRSDDMEIAEKLTMGCVHLYEKLNIMPEVLRDKGVHKEDPLYQIAIPWGNELPPVEVLEDGKTVWTVDETHNQPRWINSMVPEYILRPEAIESVFYMYRLTGDSKWRDYGWMMFENIVKYCKTPEGEFASLRDITVRGARPDNFKDSLESFWFSETLKYFYLLFDDISVLSLDDYVLNTEAHAFKLVN